MIVVGFVLVYVVLLGLDLYTRHNQSVMVPSLKGLTIDDAAAIIESADLRYEVVDSVYQKKGVPGSILDYTPKDSARVKKGRTIYLTVQARGEELISIPDLQDFSQRQAEALLNALGFTNIVLTEIPSEFKSIVISVEYKGSVLKPAQKVPKGAPLVMKVGNGSLGSLSNDTTFEYNENVEEIDETFE